MDTREALALSMGDWLRQAMRLSMAGSLRVMRARGLAMPHFIALFRIYSHPGCGVGDIAHHMDVTNAAASQMLDRLVRLGYLDRQEDPEDRRGKRLSLTESGIGLMREGMEARLDWLPGLVGQLDDGEVGTVAQAMMILSKLDMNVRSPHGGCVQGKAEC